MGYMGCEPMPPLREALLENHVILGKIHLPPSHFFFVANFKKILQIRVFNCAYGYPDHDFD